MLRILLVAAALTVSGCGAAAGPDRPDSDVTLLLGAKPAGVHAGIYLAAERGYDEAEGIDLDIRRSGDAARLLRNRRVFAAILDRPLPGTDVRHGDHAAAAAGALRLRARRRRCSDDRPTVAALVRTLQRGYTETSADPESAVQAVLDARGGLRPGGGGGRARRRSPSFTAGVPAFGYLRARRAAARRLRPHAGGTGEP